MRLICPEPKEPAWRHEPKTLTYRYSQARPWRTNYLVAREGSLDGCRHSHNNSRSRGVAATASRSITADACRAATNFPRHSAAASRQEESSINLASGFDNSGIFFTFLPDLLCLTVLTDPLPGFVILRFPLPAPPPTPRRKPAPARSGPT